MRILIPELSKFVAVEGEIEFEYSDLAEFVATAKVVIADLETHLAKTPEIRKGSRRSARIKTKQESIESLILSSLTLVQLKGICRYYGIKGEVLRRKDSMVKALNVQGVYRVAPDFAEQFEEKAIKRFAHAITPSA